MQIKITPAQFATLEAKLNDTEGVMFAQSSTFVGSIVTKDVTLSYDYDGAETLEIDVTARHSFEARIASEAQIEERINEMIAEEIAP